MGNKKEINNINDEEDNINKIILELFEPTDVIASQMNTIILMVEHLYNIYTNNTEFKDESRRDAMGLMIDMLKGDLDLLASKLEGGLTNGRK